MTAFVAPSARAKIQHRKDERWRTDISFSAIIAFDRGGEGRGGPYLYVRAEKIGMEIFTLKVRGGSFSLRLPDTKEFVYGTGRALDKLPEMIRAEDLALVTADSDALGLDPEHSTFYWNDEDYIFDIHDSYGRLRRRVKVDRRQLVLKAVREYDSLQVKQMDLLLRDHEKPYEPENWPALVPYRVIVKRPLFGLKVTIRLDGPKMKEKLPSKLFKAKTPAGWRRVSLDVQSVDSIKAFNKGR